MELDIINTPLQENDDIDIVVYLCNGQGLKMTITPFADAQALQDIICEDLHINQDLNYNVMAIWMISPLIEIQLKSYHIPYIIRLNWKKVLKKFTLASEDMTNIDEPLIQFKRNLYFSPYVEEKLSDIGLLKLLYEEIIENFNKHIYICEQNLIIQLASLCLFIKNYDRELKPKMINQKQILNDIPEFSKYICPMNTKWFDFVKLHQNSLTSKIIEDYKMLIHTKQRLNLNDLYLDFITLSHSLILYGSAFFDASIEKCKFDNCEDNLCSVTIALNTKCISIIDETENAILMTYPYTDISWELADVELPYSTQYVPALFIQVRSEPGDFQDGTAVGCDNKIYVLYSKQAPLMDAIINTNVEMLKEEMNGHEDRVDSGPSGGGNKAVCSYSPRLNQYVCFKIDPNGEVIGD